MTGVMCHVINASFMLIIWTLWNLLPSCGKPSSNSNSTSHLHWFFMRRWLGFSFVVILKSRFSPATRLVFSFFLTLLIFVIRQIYDDNDKKKTVSSIGNVTNPPCACLCGSYQHLGWGIHPFYRPMFLSQGDPAGVGATWPHWPSRPAFSSTAAACRGATHHQAYHTEVTGVCMTGKSITELMYMSCVCSCLTLYLLLLYGGVLAQKV